MRKRLLSALKLMRRPEIDANPAHAVPDRSGADAPPASLNGSDDKGAGSEVATTSPNEPVPGRSDVDIQTDGSTLDQCAGDAEAARSQRRRNKLGTPEDHAWALLHWLIDDKLPTHDRAADYAPDVWMITADEVRFCYLEMCQEQWRHPCAWNLVGNALARLIRQPDHPLKTYRNVLVNDDFGKFVRKRVYLIPRFKSSAKVLRIDSRARQ